MFMIGTLTPDRITRDADAFFDYLTGRPEVTGDRFGVCGYCMGGRISVLLAGRLPDRVAAAASFHGGGLVTDNEHSPHLLADKMNAFVYVGGAENDQSFTADQAEQLAKALTAAGVQHRIEWYQAGHGFAVPDNPPYDAAADERHWAAMTETFGEALPALGHRQVDQLRQPGAVPVGGAEGQLVALGALEEQMGGIFPRHADAAVQLHTLLGGAHGRSAAVGLRDGRRDGGVLIAAGAGVSGVAGCRRRGTDLQPQIGQPVLDRLI